MKRETFIKILSWLSFFTVSFGILSLVIFLIIRGISSLNLRLIFGTVPILEAVTGARPVWDGIWPAMAGTLLLLFVTMAIVIVPGISCGLWLSCFASERGRSVVGECVNVLAGIPSIVMGLFGLEVIILLRRTFLPNGKTCLLLSAFNCFAREHSELMKGERTYAGYGDVIKEVFDAVEDPISNAFSDAVRAICWAKEYGGASADIDCYCFNGKKLPAELISRADSSIRTNIQ